MPFLISFALEHEIVTLAWNAMLLFNSRSTLMQLQGLPKSLKEGHSRCGLHHRPSW